MVLYHSILACLKARYLVPLAISDTLAGINVTPAISRVAHAAPLFILSGEMKGVSPIYFMSLMNRYKYEQTCSHSASTASLRSVQ